MTIAKVDATTLCNAFPLTLFGTAQAWFGRLRIGTISSFKQLQEQFITQFLSFRPQNHWSNYLKTISQKDGESIREYLERFDEAVLQVSHGLPREHPISHSRRTLTMSVPAQDLEENAQNLRGVEDQGILPCLS